MEIDQSAYSTQSTQVDSKARVDSETQVDSNATRHQVLAAAKRMYAKGLVEGTQGNVSALLNNGNICITPSSIPYEEMTIGDLVIMDIHGDVLEGTQSPSSEKLLHLDCYSRFSDVKAVIHSHPIHASMFALAGKPIPAWMDEAIIYLGGDIQVSAYGMSGTPDMAANAVTVDDVTRVASTLSLSPMTLSVVGPFDEDAFADWSGGDLYEALSRALPTT